MNTSWYNYSSAIAPQIMMKPHSHHAFCPKGTVAQSPARHEQNGAFCISGGDRTSSVISEPLTMWGCRKENRVLPELPAPPKGIYRHEVVPQKTRNATTAASNGYNDNLVMLGYSNERWGGGFRSSDSLQAELSGKGFLTVCGQEGQGNYAQIKRRTNEQTP